MGFSNRELQLPQGRVRLFSKWYCVHLTMISQVFYLPGSFLPDDDLTNFVDQLAFRNSSGFNWRLETHEK